MGLEAGAIAAIASVAIPALIGVGKEIFGSSSGNVTQAGAQKMQDMQKTAGAYGAYRPDVADARMKAMSQQMSAYQGAGNMMQAMYGGGGKADMGHYTPGGGGWKPVDFPTLPPPGSSGTGGGGVPPGGAVVTGTTGPGQPDPTTVGQPGHIDIPPGTPGTYTPPRPPGNPTWKDPQVPTPPIYIPPAGGNPWDTTAGSSGASLIGNPMAAALAAPAVPPLSPNQMAALLASAKK